MKKWWRVIAALICLAVMLCGCESDIVSERENGNNKNPHKETSPVEDFEYEMVDGEVTIIGYRGFDREIYVPSVINNRNVTRIGREAFAEYDMTLIDLPETVKVIDEYAFYYCKCLVEVCLPESLERVEQNAFYGCHGLENIELPQNLQFLGYHAFDSCSKLERLILPSEFSGFSIWEYGNRMILSSPVGSDTVLVVKRGSKAERLLAQYGNGSIDYEIVD